MSEVNDSQNQMTQFIVDRNDDVIILEVRSPNYSFAMFVDPTDAWILANNIMRQTALLEAEISNRPPVKEAEAEPETVTPPAEEVVTPEPFEDVPVDNAVKVEEIDTATQKAIDRDRRRKKKKPVKKESAPAVNTPA